MKSFASEVRPHAAPSIGRAAGAAAAPADPNAPERCDDALTGLPTRAAFIARARDLQALAATMAVVSVDIDGFTDLNAQHGLAVGDAVLRETARRCVQIGRGSGGHSVVGRVGADEFALALLPPTAQRAEPAMAAWLTQTLERLQQALTQPARVGTQRLSVGASVGQARLVPGADPAEALLHAAVARRHGIPGSGASSYEAHEQAHLLTRALRAAIAADRVDIALQPKLTLADGQLSGFEALARWTLADGSVMAPDLFIALAERHKLITGLGERVLERALGTLGRWRERGLPLVPIAINFSATQFHRDDAARRVGDALARHGLPPGLLELELTESVLLGDSESVRATMSAIRRLGVRLSIDDFGTGHSSLSCLRSVAVDRLKIDRSFVGGIGSDPAAADVVQLVVQLAHRLRLRCVAEGIETAEQLALLHAMGCDEGQGFLFAQPLTPDAAAAQLTTDAAWRHHFPTMGLDARSAARH